MHQITVALPPDIPAPKFQLFQQVHTKTSKYRSNPQTGTIVGIEYVTLFVALVNDHTSYGWCYEVDFYFGESMEKALSCTDPTEEFIESDLEAVEGD